MTLDNSPYRTCHLICSCGRRIVVAVASPVTKEREQLPQWTCTKCGCVHVVPFQGTVMSVKDAAN